MHPDLTKIDNTMSSAFGKLLIRYSDKKASFLFDTIKKEVLMTINNEKINASKFTREKYKMEISKFSTSLQILKWLSNKYLAGSNNKAIKW